MPVLTVYAFKPDAAGDVFTADISPFVTKLLAHLVLTGTEFTVSGMNDAGRPTPPKGKFPCVRLPDGRVLGDSQMIIEELGTQTSLDAKLSLQQQALSHLVRRTLEESLYWNLIIEKRWRRKSMFEAVTAPRYFADALPRLLKTLGAFGFITGYVRKMVMKAYEGQGIGRHSEVEATKLAMDDLRAIESTIAGGPFFHGGVMSSIDAVLYGFVCALMYQKAAFPNEGADKEVNLHEIPKLVAHYRHMDGLVKAKLPNAAKPIDLQSRSSAAYGGNIALGCVMVCGGLSFAAWLFRKGNGRR